MTEEDEEEVEEEDSMMFMVVRRGGEVLLGKEVWGCGVTECAVSRYGPGGFACTNARGSSDFEADARRKDGGRRTLRDSDGNGMIRLELILFQNLENATAHQRVNREGRRVGREA